MADPYAEREAGAAGDRPAAAAEVDSRLRAHGGLAVAAFDDHEAADLAEAKFVAVVRRDEGLLPPLARISPAFAVALLAEPGDSAERISGALRVLEGAAIPLFLVKEGPVGGPAGRPGAELVGIEVVVAVLAAALAGEIGWEADPDFGWEIAAALPASHASHADAFCPRLLYADADRVYEHADLVVAYKQAWHQKLSVIDGVDQDVIAATGWPIQPTGQSWKD